MPIKEIRHPTTGQTFKLGRRKPLARQRAFRLGDYAKRSLPDPPSSGDWSPAALTCLVDVMGNDRLGDCTAAGACHVEGILRANAGNGDRLPTGDDAVRFYSATTGYDPAVPESDAGADEQSVLRYWQDRGLFADGSGKIHGWLQVDASDMVETSTALWLFENLYFGICLPEAWISPMPAQSGFTWSSEGDADPNNGHCIIAAGWRPGAKKIWTWGMWGWITDDAVAKYASSMSGGEIYVVLSEDSIARASSRAPSGFDWPQLLADFEGLK